MKLNIFEDESFGLSVLFLVAGVLVFLFIGFFSSVIIGSEDVQSLNDRTVQSEDVINYGSFLSSFGVNSAGGSDVLLTIDSTRGGTTLPRPGPYVYEYGDSVQLMAESEEDWSFDKWTDGDGNLISEDKEITITIEEDMTVVANFVREIVDLKIDVVGGGSTIPEEGIYSIDYGDEVSLSAVPTHGWNFSTWSGDVVSDEEQIDILMDQSKEVTAYFAKEEFDLTVDIEGMGRETKFGEGVHSIEYENVVTLNVEPEEGWAFLEWVGDVASDDPEVEFQVDEDMHLTARFVDEFEITPVIEGEGDVLINGDRVSDRQSIAIDYGRTVTLNAVADEGWEFKEWSGDMSGTDGEIDVEVWGDKEILANFERREFELRVYTEGVGSTIPEDGKLHTFEYGEEVEVEAVPGEGRVFKGWSGDITDDESKTSLIIENDMVITAEFGMEEVVDPNDDIDDPVPEWTRDYWDEFLPLREGDGTPNIIIDPGESLRIMSEDEDEKVAVSGIVLGVDELDDVLPDADYSTLGPDSKIEGNRFSVTGPSGDFDEVVWEERPEELLFLVRTEPDISHWDRVPEEDELSYHVILVDDLPEDVREEVLEVDDDGFPWFWVVGISVAVVLVVALVGVYYNSKKSVGGEESVSESSSSVVSCPGCGAEVGEDSSFCPYCGEEL